MALRLRRGTNAERLLVTPLEGELVYTTDTKKIFAGDGTTIGGTEIAGLNSVVADTTPQLGGNLDLNSQNITGIGNITIDGTVTAPQFEGNILADDSTLVFNSATQALAITNLTISGDVDITEATNKLDVFSNHASTSSNIVLHRSKGTKASPTALVDNDNIFGIKFVGHDGTSYTGGASIISDIDGNVSTGNVPGDLSFKVTNSSGVENTALRIAADRRIYFRGGDIRLDEGRLQLFGVGNVNTGRTTGHYRSRGTTDSPLVVNKGDNVYNHAFFGYDGANYINLVRTRIDVGTANISSGVMSGRYRIRVADGTGTEKTFFDIRGNEQIVRVYENFETLLNARLGDVNVFQNKIFANNSNQDLEISASGTGDVVVSGGLRSDGVKLEGNTIKTTDSNAPLELSASGTGIVSATNLTAVNYMQLPVYANNTARDSAISSPNAGMIVFNTTGTKFQGYTGAAWVDLN